MYERKCNDTLMPVYAVQFGGELESDYISFSETNARYGNAESLTE